MNHPKGENVMNYEANKGCISEQDWAKATYPSATMDDVVRRLEQLSEQTDALVARTRNLNDLLFGDGVPGPPVSCGTSQDSSVLGLLGRIEGNVDDISLAFARLSLSPSPQ